MLKFKCRQCGRTLPDDRREPGLPDAWAACRPCWAACQRIDPYKNPGGKTTQKSDVRT